MTYIVERKYTSGWEVYSTDLDRASAYELYAWLEGQRIPAQIVARVGTREMIVKHSEL